MLAQRPKCYPYPLIIKFSHFCRKAVCLRNMFKINQPTILKSSSMIVSMVTTWFMWILISTESHTLCYDNGIFNFSHKLWLTFIIWDTCQVNDKTCTLTMTTWSTIHLLQVLNCNRKGSINFIDIQWPGCKSGKIGEIGLFT